MPLLINERRFEPTVIKKASRFVSFKFGDVQLLVFWALPEELRALTLFRKNKVSETNGFFPYEWFDNPEKLNNTQLSPYATLSSKLHNNYTVRKNDSDVHNLIDRCKTIKEILSKLKLTQPSSTG